jgi:outer membrane protein assembly factor BamB
MAEPAAVWTRAYDNARSGATTSESILTPAAVRQRGVKRLFSLPTPGDARGCEAQPLIVANVAVAGRGATTLVFLATMANDVFAYDAGDGTLVWKTNLGIPINGSVAIDAHLINDHWGILSTPVIDVARGVLYACSWTSPNGEAANATHALHAVALTDGSELHPALSLEGAAYAPGFGLPSLQFRSAERKQRAALLLQAGTVFIGFGTIAESATTARGWLIAVDTARWTIAATWCSTARGSGGGIWHSGSGPAVDANGDIYVLTGNGAFDGITDFGESLVKLRYTPAAERVAARLQVSDWWTPFTDRARTGAAPAAKDEDEERPIPSNLQVARTLARQGVKPADMGGVWGDQDFGAGGPVVADSASAVLAAGKDGILYTASTAQLGKTLPADLTADRAGANYAKLKTPPILYTYYDPAVNPATTSATALNYYSADRTHHLHGTPVLWQSAAHGLMHFCGGENGNVRAWSLSPSGVSGYLACSSEYASPQAPVPLGGMPGSMLTLSSNGETDGIVWALMPYSDANMELTAGRFLAYDAQQFAQFADGSGQLVPLWDSQDWGEGCAFTHPKFNRPVVFDGRIYVPTYDGRVDVYGLA